MPMYWNRMEIYEIVNLWDCVRESKGRATERQLGQMEWMIWMVSYDMSHVPHDDDWQVRSAECGDMARECKGACESGSGSGSGSVKMWRCEDVKVWRCEAEKMREGNIGIGK
jgi:hypothetical protein